MSQALKIEEDQKSIASGQRGINALLIYLASAFVLSIGCEVIFAKLFCEAAWIQVSRVWATAFVINLLAALLGALAARSLGIDPQHLEPRAFSPFALLFWFLFAIGLMVAQIWIRMSIYATDGCQALFVAVLAGGLSSSLMLYVVVPQITDHFSITGTSQNRNAPTAEQVDEAYKQLSLKRAALDTKDPAAVADYVREARRCWDLKQNYRASRNGADKSEPRGQTYQ